MNSTLRERMKRRRRRLGLTYKALGARAGVSSSTAYNVVSGKLPTSKEAVSAVLVALDLAWRTAPASIGECLNEILVFAEMSASEAADTLDVDEQELAGFEATLPFDLLGRVAEAFDVVLVCRGVNAWTWEPALLSR